MHDLSTYGLSAHFIAQLPGPDFDRARLARVTAEHRSEYAILTQDGPGRAQIAPGRFSDRPPDDWPKVGDWVILDAPGPQPFIERVLTRRSTLARGSAGREATSQVLAANIDRVFVVAGLDRAFNPNQIERYLSVAWSSGATPVVVLNKRDLVENAHLVQLEAEAHSPGVEVILASSATAEGLNEVRAQLSEGVTGVFIGPSGAGKSTLINALAGSTQMETGSVRTGDAKGRHTTVHRQLFVLPGGGMVIDTPGMRELQLTQREGIDSVFPEIDALDGQCRFRDCTHRTEPGCGVIDAVERGEVSRERYEHYLKLQHDAVAFEVRQDERLRRQRDKSWGRLRSDGHLIRKLKGGG